MFKPAETRNTEQINCPSKTLFTSRETEIYHSQQKLTPEHKIWQSQQEGFWNDENMCTHESMFHPWKN